MGIISVTFQKPLDEIFYDIVSKYEKAIKFILIASVAVFVLFIYSARGLETFDFICMDSIFKTGLRHPQNEEIVIIQIDEDSLEAIGAWPWSRDWHVGIVNALTEAGAKAVAFDVIFSEPMDPKLDWVFGDIIVKSKRVYLPIFYELSKDIEAGDLWDGRCIESSYQPIDVLKRGLSGTGHINMLPDKDGIYRRIPPYIDFKGNVSRQFGFKIGCDISGIRDEDISFVPEKHSMILKRPNGRISKIMLDNDNQMLVHWMGGWGQAFRHYSFIRVMQSWKQTLENRKPDISMSLFKDKVCVIGLTAAGLTDIKSTPIDKMYPAVGINAMVMAMVMNNVFVTPMSGAWTVGLIIFFTVGISQVLFRTKPLGGILAAIGSILAYFMAAFALYNFFGIIVSFYPLYAIIIAYILVTVYVSFTQTVERSHLFKQATRDGLTYLYNIKHFRLLMDTEFENVKVYKNRTISVIMADIDNFKFINDTFGHAAGDKVLEEVAKTIQSKCRQTDVVARYGGEEFIVMLIGTSKQNAFNVAEDIRKAIEKKEYHFDTRAHRATISMGIAEFANEKYKEELIEKADTALYKAKRDGKNRVYIFEPSFK